MGVRSTVAKASPLAWDLLLAASIAGSLSFAAPVWGQAQSQSGQAQAPATAQDGAAVQPKYEYEVASIKPSKPSADGGPAGVRMSPGGFTASGLPLSVLIRMAYGVQDNQVENLPSWMETDRWEIDAKMDEETAAALQKMTPEDRSEARKQMLRALLEQRLKLTFHKDKKDMAIYTLVIAKNGSKLKEAKPGDDYANGLKGIGGAPGGSGSVRMSFGGDGMNMTAQGVPIATLCSTLAQSVGRQVIDKTGLTGRFDFTLNWMPDTAMSMGGGPGGPGPGGPGGTMGPGGGPPAQAAPNAPPLLEAVQEQLGLKLESGKGPADIIVIDHIEKPSEN